MVVDISDGTGSRIHGPNSPPEGAGAGGAGRAERGALEEPALGELGPPPAPVDGLKNSPPPPAGGVGVGVECDGAGAGRGRAVRVNVRGAACRRLTAARRAPAAG